jgi:cysteine desulfurase/selenocysteine lyase
MNVGFDNIQLQELELLEYGTKRIRNRGIAIFGTAKEKPPLSFNIEESSYDIGTIIDKLGIAVHRSPLCSTYYDLL